ncbi:hypothetical protein JRQ81_009727 [Phrynocephalus forsythii]|uniref:Family with sequence similarity 131 member C n=1 Tax=Phrynocephalus forsythii TaxID=171643 RepID=A0A9Q1ARZ3_9SAUR|nr:hypothetical protein JRQ81_009727 [Phrynocephalus forsythii]
MGGCQSSTERPPLRPARGSPPPPPPRGSATEDLFANAHKEEPVHPEAEGPPVAPQEGPSSPGGQKTQERDPQASSGGILSRANLSLSSGGYNVAALATSSLVGLVQTIKDHITKPTAMARGRVAHLIEWKGWSASRAGWDPARTGQEELYDDLADELKEARFAAGVAEQFAITEATLSAWSSLEEEEMHFGGAALEVVQPQDLGCIYLQGSSLRAPGGTRSPDLAESLQLFTTSGHESPLPDRLFLLPRWGELPPPARGQQQQQQQQQQEEGREPGPLWLQQSNTSLRYVDSSSLSEDDVFYN